MFDNDNDESGDSSEVQQQTDLTYRVPALTSVRDVTRRASVNFTLQVAVTSTTYGEIGTSTPAPFHRGPPEESESLAVHPLWYS